MMGRSANTMTLDELFEQGLKWLAREDNTGVCSAMAYHYFLAAFDRDKAFSKSSLYLGLISIVMGDNKDKLKYLNQCMKQPKSSRNKEYQKIAKRLLQISNPVQSFSDDDRLCISKICGELDSLHHKDKNRS